jgi:hypothetical protein
MPRQHARSVLTGIAVGCQRDYNDDMDATREQSGPQEQTPPELPEAIREAVEYGIDISLLRANLALTPAERLRRHQIALNTVEMLREAKRR